MGKVLPILILIVVLLGLGAVIIQNSPFKNLVPKSQVGVETKIVSPSITIVPTPNQ